MLDSNDARVSVRAIHLICRRDEAGSLNHLHYDKDTKAYRSGHWDLPEADAAALVGGWLYLHPTKAKPSEWGGIIDGYDLVTVPSVGHSTRVVFSVRRVRPYGDNQKWRGKSHGMAHSGGVVPADYAHEQAEA
jgi:hypothetical protein